jgi:hypothetical protein
MRGRIRLHQQSRLASRRSGTISGRRFALALALVVFTCPGVASADVNSGQMVTATVYSPGQSPTQDSVSVGALAANSDCQRYSGPGIDLHGPGTNPGQTFAALAWPLSTVLECLSVPVHVAGVTAVTVHQTDGSPEWSASSQLSHSDLVSPSDFQDPSAAPVIWSDGSNLSYYRPWRGGSDDNARDVVEQPNPAPLAIDVFEGPPLSVSATASETAVSAGSTITFGATVTPANAGGLSYNWDFDGGAPNSTATGPQVQFLNAGNYNVTVQVTDAAGGGGGDAVPITVTATNASPASRPSPNSPTTGPNTSAGKDPRGPAGNHHGTPTGSFGNNSFSNNNPDHKNRAASATHTGKHKSAAHATTTTPAPSSTPSGAQTTPGSALAPSSTTGHSTRVSGARHSSPPVKQSSTPELRATPQTPLVTGRLISDVIPLPPGASPLVHVVPASIASAPARHAVRTSLVPIVGAGLAIFLLLSLGAARELRGQGDWRTLRFGS